MGRVLYTWTGVIGDKQPNLTRFLTFPASAPEWVARTAARTYLALRGVERPDNPQAARPDSNGPKWSFRRRVVSLLERVGSPDSMRGDY